MALGLVPPAIDDRVLDLQWLARLILGGSSGMPPKRYTSGASGGGSPAGGQGSPRYAASRGRGAAAPTNSGSGVADLLSPERQRPWPSPAPAAARLPIGVRSSPGAAGWRSPTGQHRRHERGHHAGLASSAEAPERPDGGGAAGDAANATHLLTRFHNGEHGNDGMLHAHGKASPTRGPVGAGKVSRNPGRRRASSPKSSSPQRGPLSRPLHAGDGVANLLSPETQQRASSPSGSSRASPSHHRYERGHHEGLGSSADAPANAGMSGAAGGHSSNHADLTRFNNGENGTESLHHSPASHPEDGPLREDRAVRSPGRRRVEALENRSDTTSTKQAAALLPHFVGEKVAETADGWVAYREARPGGGVEVSWRRTATAEHTEKHVNGTGFKTGHKNMTIPDMVAGGGSSFNAGVPKWANTSGSTGGKLDAEQQSRLQLSSFTKHAAGDVEGQDPGSPRSVFGRRRLAAAADNGVEYGEWHREQSRREQTRAKRAGPPPTPQQWLHQRIQEARAIPAVASVLVPRDLTEFMQQMAESTIDELEVHNAEFSGKIKREYVVPQELKAWEFLAEFAQDCIQREVAKLEVIARAKTGGVMSLSAPASAAQTPPRAQPPRTPQPQPFSDVDSPTIPLNFSSEKAEELLTLEGINAALEDALEAVMPEGQRQLGDEDPIETIDPVEEESDYGDYSVPEIDLPEAEAAAEAEVDLVGMDVLPVMPGKGARKEMFERMDLNKNGVLSLGEIHMGVEKYYPQFYHKLAMLRACKAADVNGDGFIARREFRLLLEYLVFFSNAWTTFDAFDVDGDHRLAPDEFFAGCQRLGLEITAEEASEDFRNIDTNGGGYVLFEEFSCWAGQRKLGETKQLWPKYSTAVQPMVPDVDESSMQAEEEYVEQYPKRNRHARVVSPDRGRLSKPNRIWVNNKWQDTPREVALDGPVSDRLTSPVAAVAAAVSEESLDQPESSAMGREAASSLASPERLEPSHLLTSPERRTLRNRESARRDTGNGKADDADDALAVSLTGIWRAKGERRDGTRVEQSILLRHEQDGRVTGGHVDGINGFFVIKDGRVDGSTVIFRQEYSNGNRVLWKASIEQTLNSGIMLPKLVDGTWSGANMQGSFGAALSTTRLTGPAEAAGPQPVALSHLRTALSAKKSPAGPKQQRKFAATGSDTKRAATAVSSSSSFASAIPAPRASPVSKKRAHRNPRDLSGLWVAQGATTTGVHSHEELVLSHDVRTGEISGQNGQHEGDEGQHCFEIIDGRLDGNKLQFVQKFADGVETMW